ncbi:acyltransferase family protein [Fibrobacter succinogenes]|uniref:Peptidoglycan/LPS O-acetylase OafA/YrhL, contains acyltransferase and SGNH-hydrolase domains n=1 Tax=Fibrobacter succinogenes TaxID=833 RepID=A0A380S5B9_FIBSU|nr:acyltransferase [Fibrobacter succinogenes]PWJ35754.1 peptidoglycan/LPS O-acetylase OafA/YrhL [Fibrobacter succinogenes subsp. elongatus]SUQ24409.1 Peptidoglycan/LPS O-acetylase OafA/YrhL, contains acyltransferase and SGNH-hydrolase domains [Fibrobacter succinogenes]
MIIDKSKMQHRAAGLDLFRVVAAVMVLLFHCNIHHDNSFGLLTGFVSMGAVFMTAFFMLSGYVLFLTYKDKSLVQAPALKNFYLKRVFGIFPLYLVVAVLYVVTLGEESVFQNLVLLPIELLGLQSVFSTLFPVSHNGGTWFISCLLFAYLAFPLMQEIVKQMTTRTKWMSLAICSAILFWSPLVVHTFKTDSIYSNPFFRGLEFFIGVLLCSLPIRDGIAKILATWKALLVEVLLLVAGVSIAVRLNIFVGNYMLYDWIVIPLFACMILTLASLKSPRLQNSKVLRYASAASYAFFLAQTFNTEIENWLFAACDIQNNVLQIVMSVALCAVMAIALHELVEKPCAKVLKKKL